MPRPASPRTESPPISEKPADGPSVVDTDWPMSGYETPSTERPSDPRTLPNAIAIFVISMSGTIVDTNSTALKVLGRGTSEVLGRHYGHLLALDDDSSDETEEWEFADPLVRCLALQVPYMTVRGLCYGEGATAEPFAGAIAPIHGRNGEPVGAVVIAAIA